MRISDWSSDVCSSDLRARRRIGQGPHTAAGPACRGPKRPKQWQYDPSRPRRALQGHRRDEPLACQAGRRKNSIDGSTPLSARGYELVAPSEVLLIFTIFGNEHVAEESAVS